MEFSKDLVDTLKKNKKKEVFINDEGQWLFYEREGYEKYDASEVIGEPSETPTGKTKGKGKDKDKDQTPQ